MSQGLSLHIGLNEVDPVHYGGWKGTLRGCENDARDMAALARALGRLAGDRALLLRMAEKARGQARGFGGMAEELVGLYREVTGGRRPGA